MNKIFENIEFYNYWKYSDMDFILFRVMRIDEAFAFQNALSITIFNFEIRVYWNKPIKESK